MRAYSTREVAEIAGLSPRQIRGWARAGLVHPAKDANGHWRYSFQDLALLRTAGKLLRAKLSPNRVTRSLRLIREQLPAGRPLSAVRILIHGRNVVVRDRLASWEPDSRQGTLDFDLLTMTAPIAADALKRDALKRTVPATSDTRTTRATSTAAAAAGAECAQSLYEAALDLELAGHTNEARNAYAAALARDPELVAARINLGRLLQAAGKLREAEASYRTALEQEPGNVLAAFNLGVALEEQDRNDEAVESYRRALAIDPCYADAHFNLSRLLELRGDLRGALRHLSTFKRLLSGT